MNDPSTEFTVDQRVPSLFRLLTGVQGRTNMSVGRCCCGRNSISLRYPDGYRSIVRRDAGTARLWMTLILPLGAAIRRSRVHVGGGEGARRTMSLKCAFKRRSASLGSYVP